MLITRKKDILVLREGPTQGFEGTTLTVDKKFSISFTEHNKKFCRSFHYNGENSYLIDNGADIHKFKVKGSEIAASPLCSFQKTFL